MFKTDKNTFYNHREMLSKGGLDSRANYIGEVLPDNFVNVCGQQRDSDVLERANFKAFLDALGGESESVRVEHFGHWAVGWIEEVFVDINNSEKMKIADEITSALSDYPVIDEDLFSEMEMGEADEVWKNYYSEDDRLKYIKEHRYQFEGIGFSNLMKNVRGEMFSGYASELIN